MNKNGQTFYKDQLQPNAGKIPALIEDWRKNNGDKHGVMTVVLIGKDATKEEVSQAVHNCFKKVKF